MSVDPNYYPNKNATDCTTFSNEDGTSFYNAPSGEHSPAAPPPRPTPFPPSQLQQYQFQPPKIYPNKTPSLPDQLSSYPPSQHLVPTHLPPPNMQLSRHPAPPLPPLSQPPPSHPPPSHPPPSHPGPQLTQLHCPPPNFYPPPSPWLQAPSQSFQNPLPSCNPRFITNQQQMQSNYREKEKFTEKELTSTNKSNMHYNKLSMEDMNWLRGFQESKVNCRNNFPLKEKSLTENIKLKPSDVSSIASESQSLLQTLARLKTEMEQNAPTATPEDWQNLLDQVELTKEKFNHNIIQLQNPKLIKLIWNRRRKRERLKANKNKLKKEKHIKLCEWKQKEIEIDIWRERIIKEESNELREKKIKEEADSVLSEIRFKESEASSMIQLLDALKQLRKTRTSKGDKFGYVSNSFSDNCFTSVMSKLQGLVSSHLSDYKLEEATLRVMMEASGIKKSSKLPSKQDKDSRYTEVRDLIFGQNSYKTANEEFDLPNLLCRRHEWDEFLTSKENPLGSSVPPGWVVPPTNPSQQWAEFLPE